MSETYTKLFTSITASTVWQEPLSTRVTWITMLAMADQNGDVYASVPGLARFANVPREDVERALECFLSPDPDSRSQDNEGRRIEVIKGGWRLLNHAAFHALKSEAERTEYKREWDRKNRPSGYARQSDSPSKVRQSDTKSDSPTVADTPDQTKPLLQEQEQKLSARQVARSGEGRFPEWWAVYPKKVARKPALQKWQSRGLDAIADRLIADVRNRIANDDGWKRGYIPDPTTYLNQDRWNDDLRAAPRERTPAPAAPSKTLSLIQKLEGMKHGLAGNRTSHGPAEVALLGTGTDPRD